MRAALYARFSSDKQDAELSISGQLESLKEYADKHGYEYKDRHIYVDEAKSALSDNRPAFKQMIADAKSSPKPFDLILVWKLSRFARSRQDSIVYKSLLEKQGIDVISIKEQFDDSPAGQLLEGIIEVIDEFYSTNLAQDTLRGMAENARRGFFNGGSVPTGYKRQKVKDGTTERSILVPDPTYAPVIKRIFSMAANGDSMKTIAQTLNQEGITTRAGKQWATNAIRNILDNEIYTGTLVWNKHSDKETVRMEDTHPAIIDSDTFEQVQTVLEQKRSRRNAAKAENGDYLLSGILTCGQCGGSLTGYSVRVRGKKYEYYACTQTIKKGKDVCGFKRVRKDMLDALILDHVQEGLKDEAVLESFVEEVNRQTGEREAKVQDELAATNTKIQSAKKRLNKLYDAIETDTADPADLAPRIKELRSSIDQLEETKADLQEQVEEAQSQLVDFDKVKVYLEQLRDLLPNVPRDRKKYLLQCFIHNLTVFEDRVAIDSRLPIADEVLTESLGIYDFEEEWLPGVDLNHQPSG